MAVRASDKVTLVVLPAPTYVRLYYVLQASALAAPALPTTNPPAAPWTATEPTYTAGSTNTLYTTLLTAYGSLTFDYGAVQVSSTYDAAKAAFNKAVAVESTANGKNTIVRSGSAPTNPPAAIYKVGDLWWVFVGTQVTAMWVHDGTNWISQSLTGATITNLDAGVITAGIITGRTLQTAVTGKRVVIDGPTNTLKFFGDTSTSAAVITGSDDGGAAATAITITTALESVRFGHTFLPVSGSVEMLAPSAWIQDLYITTLTDDANRLLLGSGGIIGSGGVIDPATGKLRLSGAGDVDLTGDTSPFMIGSKTGLNIVMDTNEFQARNNGVASAMYINSNGGGVTLGNAASIISIGGHIASANYPHAEAAGSVYSPAGGTLISPIYYSSPFTVTMPSGRFTVNPIVTLAPTGLGVLFACIQGSTGNVSFSAVMMRLNASMAASSHALHWHAIQMSSSAAAG